MLIRLRSLLPVAVLLFAITAHAARYDVGGPRSTNNDDSCDIADLPAATLLLPYFEVDLQNINGETTLFTVTNVTEFPQIARVTLWTDLAVPLLSFNVFLTGYDVQAINLRDVLTLGRIGDTGTGVSHFGPLGRPSNTGINTADCTTIAPLTQDAVVRLQRALTEGTLDGCGKAGNVHANATGYATIDVVGACTNRLPTDAAYFTSDIRYDNVLIGDYQQVHPAQNSAQGGPMVHIRAVPEGTGTTNLTRTFYGRFTSGTDRRQPLPSRFASRWIQGGTAAFKTDVKIWRELSNRAGGCADADLSLSDQVVFDEAENGVGYDGYRSHPPPGFYTRIALPATGRYAINDPQVFAQITNEAIAGWLYFNADRPDDALAEQAWMITSMRAENRFSVDFNATGFGNGCSPPALVADPAAAGPNAHAPIAPSPNGPATIFPTGAPLTTNNDDSCDIAMLPAATLLLPYFEVDLTTPPVNQTTIFTIVNVTNAERVARVTLWTDYGYPVITFNVYLTGYDAQAINLFDVIARGLIAPDNGTGTLVSRKGQYSTSNPDLDVTLCNRLPGALDPVYIVRMQQAFTLGHVPAIGTVPACDTVGGVHARAVGYATIDVVGSCGFTLPTDADYFTRDILYDNVLTGDYEQIDLTGNHAQGAPLVHIRAIPEGGTQVTRQSTPALTTNLERTFYGRIAPRAVSDARQPLPSTFAARWILGGPDSFNTTYKIWREPQSGTGLTCATFGANAKIGTIDIVTFDENENYVTGDPPTLPATSMMAATGMPNGARAGWTFFNLDAASNDLKVTQNWINVSMRAQGRFSVDFEAPALGNGCSNEQSLSNAHGQSGSSTIGPRP